MGIKLYHPFIIYSTTSHSHESATKDNAFIGNTIIKKNEEDNLMEYQGSKRFLVTDKNKDIQRVDNNRIKRRKNSGMYIFQNDDSKTKNSTIGFDSKVSKK